MSRFPGSLEKWGGISGNTSPYSHMVTTMSDDRVCVFHFTKDPTWSSSLIFVSCLDLGGIRVWEQAQASNLWWPHDFLLGGSSKSSPEAFTLVHDRRILTVGPRRHMHHGPAAWESVTRLLSFVLSYRWVTEKLPAIFHFHKLNPKGLWGVAH